MHLLFLSVMIYPLQHTLRLKCSKIYAKSFDSNIENILPLQILFPFLYWILYLFLKKNHKRKKQRQQQLVQLFGNSTANPCWESFGWKPHEFCRRRLKLCFQSSIAGVVYIHVYIWQAGVGLQRGRLISNANRLTLQWTKFTAQNIATYLPTLLAAYQMSIFERTKKYRY